jgi:hypothetical protein
MHCSKDSSDPRHGLMKQIINTADRRHLFERSNIKSYSFAFRLSLCHERERLHGLRGMRRLQRREMQPSSAVQPVRLLILAEDKWLSVDYMQLKIRACVPHHRPSVPSRDLSSLEMRRLTPNQSSPLLFPSSPPRSLPTSKTVAMPSRPPTATRLPSLCSHASLFKLLTPNTSPWVWLG